MPATDINSRKLELELNEWRKHFNAGSRGWSLAYGVTSYGTALASIATTFAVQYTIGGLELTKWFALLAAILATIAATGGFERKWKANRLSRSEVDILRLDLSSDTPDLGAIRLRLQDVIRRHDAAILAAPEVKKTVDASLANEGATLVEAAEKARVDAADSAEKAKKVADQARLDAASAKDAADAAKAGSAPDAKASVDAAKAADLAEAAAKDAERKAAAAKAIADAAANLVPETAARAAAAKAAAAKPT